MSETGSFTEPKDWSGSSSLPPDAASPALGLQVPSIGITGMFIRYCTWVLGTKLRSLHLCSKLLTDQAIFSPAPSPTPALLEPSPCNPWFSGNTLSNSMFSVCCCSIKYQKRQKKWRNWERRERESVSAGSKGLSYLELKDPLGERDKGDSEWPSVTEGRGLQQKGDWELERQRNIFLSLRGWCHYLVPAPSPPASSRNYVFGP